jgi:hypothetical protein
MRRENHPHYTEAHYRQLCGWQIQGVHYTEVDLCPARPRPYYQTDNPNLHTVDIALCLCSSAGQNATISWREMTPSQHSLQLRLGAVNAMAGQRTWDASEESIWQALIGHSITGVDVLEAPLNQTTLQKGNEEPHSYVQTLVLWFSNGKPLFISAAELPLYGWGKAIRGADNLLITGDETLAKECELFVAELYKAH